MEKPSPLKVIPEEKAQVKVLVEQVVQLVRDGVTGMDLLESFSVDASNLFMRVIIQCGCTLGSRIPLGSTRRASVRIPWRSG